MPKEPNHTIKIEFGEVIKLGLYQAEALKDWGMRERIVKLLFDEVGIPYTVTRGMKSSADVIDIITSEHNNFLERVKKIRNKDAERKANGKRTESKRNSNGNPEEVGRSAYGARDARACVPALRIPYTPVAPTGGERLSGQDEETSWWDWWRAYPKKVGQDSARRTWHAVFEDLPPVEKMLAALKWQSASDEWTRDNGRYIPSASTYLSDGRWKDEPSGGPAPASADVQPVLSPDIAELERVMAERRRKASAQ